MPLVFVFVVTFFSVLVLCSNVFNCRYFLGSETLHSWELVNISDTAEIGRQECNYLFANK